ncbi:MAG: hypothetical protein QM401_04145 [Bacillota bacterium]|nr:hypothetical protein [Bacillota bacterium]
MKNSMQKPAISVASLIFLAGLELEQGGSVMGADDFHVSADIYRQTRTVREQKSLDTYKRVEELAYKWFDGEIDDRRMAEAVFGLINGEADK